MLLALVPTIPQRDQVGRELTEIFVAAFVVVFVFVVVVFVVFVFVVVFRFLLLRLHRRGLGLIRIFLGHLFDGRGSLGGGWLFGDRFGRSLQDLQVLTK